MNLTSFSGWRLTLRTTAGWRYGSQHSTTYHMSLDMLWDRAFSFTSAVWPWWAVQPKESEAVRKGQVLSGDAGNTLTWACKSSLFYRKKSCTQGMFLYKRFNHCILGNLPGQCVIGLYFHWESPCILPKGIRTFCVAKELCHFVCNSPIRLLLNIWRFITLH